METGCAVMRPILQPKVAARQRKVAPVAQLERAPISGTMQPMVASKEKARAAFSARLVEALAELPTPVVGHAAQKAWLSAEFGMSGEAARKWLQGETMPNQARWGDLARKLRVLPSWLRDGVGPKRIEPAAAVREAPSSDYSDRAMAASEFAAVKFALVSLFEWISESSPVAAARLVDRMNTAVPEVAAHPLHRMLLDALEEVPPGRGKRAAAAR